MHRDIVVIAPDLRSTHNVGSLLRTCEGLGVSQVLLTGYTPYPLLSTTDSRLPHIANKLDKQITKTALGAEQLVPWTHVEDTAAAINQLKQRGYEIIGLEQTASSTPLPDYRPAQQVAIVIGREVEGIDPSLVALCDHILEIPMLGHKESFNVVQAAAMALYHCRFQ